MHVPYNHKQKQVYAILSVDTEHNIMLKYETITTGWSKRIPLLLEIFDASRMSGEVSSLIEYNLKDGIMAMNPSSDVFVKEFPQLIIRIKNKGDELVLHPTMYDWWGGARGIPASAYNDPEFVMNLIALGVQELVEATGINPTGCRTGALHYATHLASALEKHRIYLDNSIVKGLKERVTAPNAYYACRHNIRHNASTKTGVVKVPTTGYIRGGWQISC